MVCRQCECGTHSLATPPAAKGNSINDAHFLSLANVPKKGSAVMVVWFDELDFGGASERCSVIVVRIDVVVERGAE